MNFMLAKGGWSVSFLEEECKISLHRHFVFQSEKKILYLARHGGAEYILAFQAASKPTARSRFEVFRDVCLGGFSNVYF